MKLFKHFCIIGVFVWLCIFYFYENRPLLTIIYVLFCIFVLLINILDVIWEFQEKNINIKVKKK